MTPHSTLPPRLRAINLYAKHSPFFHDVENYCLTYGVVISTADIYFAGMFCDHTDNDHTLLDLHACASRQRHRLASPPTMIHAWLAVGSLASLASHLPTSPPWISFERFRDQRGIRRLPSKKFFSLTAFSFSDF